MSLENQRPLENGHKEFKLILPTLLPPFEGAFEEVYMDYLSDPDRFKVALEYRLNTDNPSLLTFFEEHQMTANPNLANKWMCIYYAMFERSAKKEGLPPLRVSTRIINSYNRMGIVNAVNGFETGTEQEVVRKIKADWERRKERDKAFSPELVRFWNSVDEDMRQMKEEEEDEDYDITVVGDILPVVSLQTVLQMQQDEFSLIEKYEL